MNITVKTNPKEEIVTVMVGKNVFKKAVERNLFKRRVRSILLPVSKRRKTGFRVRANPSAAKLKFAEIKEEILKQL